MLAIKPREGLTKDSGSGHRFFWGLTWTLITFLLCSSPAQAATVRLLVSGGQPYYREVQQHFTETLLDLSPETTISVSVLGSDTMQSAPWPEDIIVSIGTPATELAHQNHTGKKTIALFITTDVWHRLTDDHSNPGTNAHAAVVIDQTPYRILLLARLLIPEARTIASVMGPISSASLTDLQQSTEDLDFTLTTKTLDEKDNPVATLSPLLKNNDAFVALPDSAVFNRAIAKWALYLGFRNHTPIIGFSKAYTDAGALASIYTKPSDIGRHGAELSAKTLLEPRTFDGGLHHPRYYTLHSNTAVARALNIDIPDQTTLYRMYEAALATEQ